MNKPKHHGAQSHHGGQSHDVAKAIAYFLETMADILLVGGPPFQPALNEVRQLINSGHFFDPAVIKRHSFNLSEGLDEIKRRLDAGQVDIKTDAPPREAFRADSHETLVNALSAIVDAIASLRPAAYKDQQQELLKMLRRGPEWEKFFPVLNDFIIQIREDIWAEKTSALERIGDILKALEATEVCFTEAVSGSLTYAERSEQAFTAAVATGLQEIGGLIEPNQTDLEELCRRVSQKVNHLHAKVQLKKQADQARFDALMKERRSAEKRLAKTRRDYEEFNAQSHEMFKEIEALRTISLHDPLTGVYNRRAFDSQIAATVAAVKANDLKTAGLAVFDIDNFRDFNNNYGHLAGDRVLAHVARVAAQTLRRDDLFFRYGGDEFVIIMPNAALMTAYGVADKVRTALWAVEFKIFKNSAQTARVTVSMGVAEIAKNDDPSSFFNRADQALYDAKKSGRNQVSARSFQPA